MQGVIKKVDHVRQFGFIRAANIDYFFHRDDFDGTWADLCEDFDKGGVIEVEFEPTKTDKGPRAAEVHLA